MRINIKASQKRKAKHAVQQNALVDLIWGDTPVEELLQKNTTKDLLTALILGLRADNNIR